MKRIAIVDKTGRGHSICQALIDQNSDILVYYIPRTGGVFDKRIITVADLSVSDGASIASFCHKNDIDLIAVTHIDAITNDVASYLRSRGFVVFGPSAQAGQLESSKDFCKSICSEAGISTPKSSLVENVDTLRHVRSHFKNQALMIKADWLTTNGNGAIKYYPTESDDNVIDELKALQKQNQNAPFKFLVEEFQEGFDYSAHFFVNESSVVELPSSQDFKMSHCGDTGKNCDGMGSCSPHPLDSPQLQTRIRIEVLDPLLNKLEEKCIAFVGAIYLGLRIDSCGKPHLIEINARMGDSESQVIFPRISEDIYSLFVAIGSGHAINKKVKLSSLSSVIVSLVTGSDYGDAYPEFSWPIANTSESHKIYFDPVKLTAPSKIYWANVLEQPGGTSVSGNGRVAHVTGLGGNLVSACKNAYEAILCLRFKNMRYRCDIAQVSSPHLCECNALSPCLELTHDSGIHIGADYRFEKLLETENQSVNT